jgi:hypothetical protein
MRAAARHGPARSHQRLADHLATKHPLPPALRVAAPEQIHLEGFEIEDAQNGLNRRRHRRIFPCKRGPESHGYPMSGLSESLAWAKARQTRRQIRVR